MTNEQQSREAFETFMQKSGGTDAYFLQQNETYIIREVRIAWDAWQAALATRDTAPAMSENDAVEIMAKAFNRNAGKYHQEDWVNPSDLLASYRALLTAGGVPKQTIMGDASTRKDEVSADLSTQGKDSATSPTTNHCSDSVPGIRQADEALASSLCHSTSRESLGNSCESSDTKRGDDVERLRGSLEFIRDRARNQIRICEGKGNYVAHAIVKECDAALAATPSRCEGSKLKGDALADFYYNRGFKAGVGSVTSDDHKKTVGALLVEFSIALQNGMGPAGFVDFEARLIQSMQRRPVGDVEQGAKRLFELETEGVEHAFWIEANQNYYRDTVREILSAMQAHPVENV